MTPTQQTLRNLINEKCPELLCVRIGCEFNNPKAIDWARTVKLVCYNETNGLYHFAEPDGSVFSCYQKVVDTFEILGTPPDLSHLLRAIGNSVAVDADGDFWDNKGKVHDLYYDLFKSPLDQDEPTLLALIELIK